MPGPLAALACAVLLAGCATRGPSSPSSPSNGSPAPGTRSFAAFSIAKTGGIAGVSERINVGQDGTVSDASGKVVGHIGPADLAELRTLLTGKEIRAEAARARSREGSRCADGFSFTLVMGDLRVSDYSCGPPADKPAFKRVLELTSASHIQTR
jgi:hypothetical protein